MSRDGDLRVSRHLQWVAGVVETLLSKLAGEPVKFSLLIWSDGRAQYVSNAEREGCTTAMRELLARWDEGTPDVPEHHRQ